MTFSIAACDLNEKTWGVAVASKFLAVGAVVPWARAGVGAVATQSYANTTFGPRGLDMMALGVSASQALETVLAGDPQSAQRQAGMVDALGRAATFTGGGCYSWAGGLTGEGYAIQGNILAGPQVVEAMQAAFLEHAGKPLLWRLYHALFAGDRAGGDRRGRQSAAILVVKAQGGYAGFNDRLADYRIDDDPDPVARLAALLEQHDLYFSQSAEDERVPLSGETLRSLLGVVTRLGYYRGSPDAAYDDAARAALSAWIGNENFEDRVDFDGGWMDRPVLEYLLKRFAP
jgi:uncharacterized Ntn-hydrolase superfamily protein